MDNRILVICPGDYGNLKAECTYTIEDIFDEIDRLSDENDSLKEQISDMEDDIAENYTKKSAYECCGMSEWDFV